MALCAVRLGAQLALPPLKAFQETKQMRSVNPFYCRSGYWELWLNWEQIALKEWFFLLQGAAAAPLFNQPLIGSVSPSQSAANPRELPFPEGISALQLWLLGRQCRRSWCFCQVGTSHLRCSFNFILPGRAEQLLRFLCFHLLLAADNSSANGFGNWKFPLGFVGFIFFPLSLGKRY